MLSDHSMSSQFHAMNASRQVAGERIEMRVKYECVTKCGTQVCRGQRRKQLGISEGFKPERQCYQDIKIGEQPCEKVKTFGLTGSLGEMVENIARCRKVPSSC